MIVKEFHDGKFLSPGRKLEMPPDVSMVPVLFAWGRIFVEMK
jgi:hypothetical protein